MGFGLFTKRAVGACIATVALLAVSCSASDSGSDDGGESSESCAKRIEFRDVIYTEIANVPAEVAGEVGMGRRLGCSDSDETNSDEAVRVHKIKGVDRFVMIATTDSREQVDLFLAVDQQLPSRFPTSDEGG